MPGSIWSFAFKSDILALRSPDFSFSNSAVPFSSASFIRLVSICGDFGRRDNKPSSVVTRGTLWNTLETSLTVALLIEAILALEALLEPRMSFTFASRTCFLRFWVSLSSNLKPLSEVYSLWAMMFFLRRSKLMR